MAAARRLVFLLMHLPEELVAECIRKLRSPRALANAELTCSAWASCSGGNEHRKRGLLLCN